MRPEFTQEAGAADANWHTGCSHCTTSGVDLRVSEMNASRNLNPGAGNRVSEAVRRQVAEREAALQAAEGAPPMSTVQIAQLKAIISEARCQTLLKHQSINAI